MSLDSGWPALFNSAFRQSRNAMVLLDEQRRMVRRQCGARAAHRPRAIRPFAGYEIDLRRIAGVPLRLAAVGCLLSLAIAYGIGGLLAAAGIVLSLVYTGSALATTAIGTLIPVLSDSGELRTRFGGYLLAAGAVGEFGRSCC